MNNTSYSSDNEQDTIKKTDIYKYKFIKPMDKIKYKPDHLIYHKLVKEIDLINIKPQRAGVIMYCMHDNKIYYGLGIDTVSGELTDFGGGISYKEKRDKNVILGALREYDEETLWILGISNYEDVVNCKAIYNHNNLIIFKNISLDPYTVRNMFLVEYNKMLEKRILPEVCDIKWMNVTEFKECISKRGCMFHRVQCFLQQAGDFLRFL